MVGAAILTLALSFSRRGEAKPLDLSDAQTVELAPAKVRPGKAALVLDLTFPPGWHLNPAAPLRYGWAGRDAVTVGKPRLPLRLAFDAAGRESLALGVAFAYCRGDGKGVCKTRTVLFKQPLRPDPKGAATVLIRHRAD